MAGNNSAAGCKEEEKEKIIFYYIIGGVLISTHIHHTTRSWCATSVLRLSYTCEMLCPQGTQNVKIYKCMCKKMKRQNKIIWDEWMQELSWIY